MSRCIGCGVILQNENSKRLGYVPLNAQIEKGEHVYCKRCHDLRHYNKEAAFEDFASYNEQFFIHLNNLKQKNVLILLMIDILDIYSGFIPNLVNYIGQNPVMIILNKVDLVPKGIKTAHLLSRTREIAKQEGLKVIGIKTISALKQKNINMVMEQLLLVLNRKNSLIEDVYVIGCTSVGKSTFINQIIAGYGDGTPDLLTTSERHQTTLNLIKIPLGRDRYKRPHQLIDTPGFVNPHQVGTYLSYESTRLITPKKPLRVRTYQLKPPQTIFLGGLARLDFLKGEKISSSFFVSNDLYLHRTKYEQADLLFERQIGQILTPPITDDEIAWAKSSKKYCFELEDASLYDLVIGGLGFVHLVGTNLILEVTVPKQINVAIVPSMITDKSNELS